MRHTVRRIIVAGVLSIVMAAQPSISPVLGLSQADKYCLDRFCPSYSNETALCPSGGVATITEANSANTAVPQNVAAAKEYILKQTRAINLYKQLESSYNIPWQMFAIIHYRESSNKIANNGAEGEGAWGFYGGYHDQAVALGFDLTANKALSDAEFLAQGSLAAKIIRDKAGSRNSKLDKTARSADVIAWTFFGYNGRAQFYKDQALRIGLSRTQSENGEGSPYVSNYASVKQSPANPEWKQIFNNGATIGPANTQVGAWTLFAVLANVAAAGADCSGSLAPIGSIQRVVDVANRVPIGININQAKSLGLVVNSYPSSAAWCAIFATQLYKNAGVTLPGGKWGAGLYSWAADPVRLTKAYSGQFVMINPFKGQKAEPGDFIVWADGQVDNAGQWQTLYDFIANTPLGSDGDPKAGDGNGIQHVGIVVAVSGNSITTVEGNTRYPVPNGVTKKDTYNFVPGQSNGWTGQIFGFIRRVR